ncbi:hypothetical protein CRI87_12835 [Liquorilactobacillus satsumensis]|uniref:hypothetical protein n=1 Tax=Liquorilactobacillus satsumensis TaxID=259059 RepID=UPI001E604900|nr:hypothetical protein [Liquorilactobacillus satsumensis]MCC7667962.1 hypothetical protein [Liquorilactobacillus satsumensis]
MDIDEQLQRAEERVKALKKRKAEQDLRDELEMLKNKINAIEKLNQLTVNSTDENGQKFKIQVVKFDDILAILKR